MPGVYLTVCFRSWGEGELVMQVALFLPWKGFFVRCGPACVGLWAIAGITKDCACSRALPICPAASRCKTKADERCPAEFIELGLDCSTTQYNMVYFIYAQAQTAQNWSSTLSSSILQEQKSCISSPRASVILGVSGSNATHRNVSAAGVVVGKRNLLKDPRLGHV